MAACVETITLEELLRREGTLDPERAFALVAQLADALDTARFSRGLVHGNVGPASVLIEEPGRASERASLLGFRTRGDDGVTARTDIYSLGCVLRECLVDPPAGLDRVIAKATATSPDDRYSTCGELIAATRVALAADTDEPESEQPDFPPTPAASPAEPGTPLVQEPLRINSRRLLSLAVTAVLIAVGAFAAGWLARGSDADRTSHPQAAAPSPQGARDGGEGDDGAKTSGGAAPSAAMPAPAGARAEASSVPAAAPTGGGTLVRIDPATNEIVARIPVGRSAGRIGVGTDAVWVSNADDGTVSKVDPRTNAVVATIGVSGRPGQVATGQDDQVWVATGYGVAEIAPSTGVASLLPLGEEYSGVARRPGLNGGLMAPVFGAGFLWVAYFDEDTVLRVDPETGEVVAKIEGVEAPHSVAAGYGALWVANHRAHGSVSRIDPTTNAVVQTIDVEAGVSELAVGEGGVWVTGGSSVTRIDPETGEVAATIALLAPGPVEVGYGAVWVGGASTLSRIDPATNAVVQTISVGTGSDGLAVGEGGVWVTTNAPEEGAEAAASAEPSGELELGSLRRIDPTRNEIVVGKITLGEGSGPITVAKGAVWVANTGDGTVSEIDPETMAVVDTIGVGGTPSGIAFDDETGYVWVADQSNRTLARFAFYTDDRVSLLPFSRAAEDEGLDEGFSDVAVGADSVWAASFDGTVSRIDPLTGEIVATIADVGPPAPSGFHGFHLAVGAGAVWVTSEFGATVSRIDPARNEIAATVKVGAHPWDVIVAGGSVWVTDEKGISRIDPATNQLVQAIDVGAGNLAYGEGSVWVANHGEGTVSRIDPVTGKVVATIPVGGAAYGIAVGERAVWLASL